VLDEGTPLEGRGWEDVEWYDRYSSREPYDDISRFKDSMMQMKRYATMATDSHETVIQRVVVEDDGDDDERGCTVEE
jgi:hypothetical protein